MDEQVERLVKKTWAKFLSTPPDARLMIAISGIPGSGKTELARMVANRINVLYSAENPNAVPIATSLPMDGYHLTRAQLAAMPDPVYAAARRGAAFTFDGDKFLALVQSLREPLTTKVDSIYAPSFDHAVKDPVMTTSPSRRRGNYLSLDKEPWSQAAKLMDELWFVDVDFEVARKRLIKRHVKAGIARDEEEADRRARENDLVNGREIVDNRLEAQEVISSIYDPAWEKL
ncbi:Phosphoribulokinase/uridine kinase [Penicillium maclennaniae]|uniref:Phosphoribulokinase/uridine kinase n=1 Tax=Penicillium maclennaniae TaxID=1343394 RepID=UPI002542106D|nr:Phosphoribulokinase/uridine kinase [Penicillium maclennaniae]KAJ5665719.1 Phosphoribulokinase/uridine kinase [Penicillium maclennaniae]